MVGSALLVVGRNVAFSSVQGRSVGLEGHLSLPAPFQIEIREFGGPPLTNFVSGGFRFVSGG